MLKSVQEKKTQSFIIPQEDDTALANGVRKCSVYRTFNPNTKETQFYFGGGLYNEQSESIILWTDFLRPALMTNISKKELVYMRTDGLSTDLLCKDGTWISGLSIPKVKSDNCSLRDLKFDDARVVTMYEDIAVVNMAMIDSLSSDNTGRFSGLLKEIGLLGYPNPLTVAYVKQEDITYIGFWDITENKFVGRLRKYWIRLLDIGL